MQTESTLYIPATFLKSPMLLLLLAATMEWFAMHVSRSLIVIVEFGAAVFASFNFTMACVNIIFPNRIQRLEVFAYSV